MPSYTITLPTLHPDQVKALLLPGRFKAIRCGRRWGKSKLAVTVACDAAIKSQKIGIFAPDYKRLIEPRSEIFTTLRPLRAQSSKTEGQFNTTTGGQVDFWTLNDELAGRGREYHGVVIDEAAFTAKNMMDIWKRAIRPTLVRFRGWVIVLSNTNGIDEEQFFYTICTDPSHGFVEYHAPSHNNPLLPPEELEELERTEMPLVFAQEYKADFINWAGVAFFALPNLLVNDQPVAYPTICDAVFATIDTATKTGKRNDGTGVVYWSINKRFGDLRLTILDYDYTQIEGSLLETWLPTVFENLKVLAEKCGSRAGSLGAFIEDKSSGMVLLQHVKRRSWPGHAIDSKLTAMGKSERAISVSGYIYRGWVKFSHQAYNRLVIYKARNRNHLLNQVTGFRVGDDEEKDDDLLDCFTYGSAIALGNQEGF